MELNINDRICILNELFIPNGDWVDVRLMRDIRKKIDITQDEMKTISLKKEQAAIDGKIGTYLTWNNELASSVISSVDFAEAESGFLKKQIERIASEKKITEKNIDLFEKIQSL